MIGKFQSKGSPFLLTICKAKICYLPTCKIKYKLARYQKLYKQR
jgi:hypothetical protein